MYLRIAIGFAMLLGQNSWAGQTYPDLMDAAIYNTYGGGGFFYPANCSVCHAAKPETALNAVTDFGSNFTFVGRNLLGARPNLANLTLTEMTTIVQGMEGFDPDSDGWTNEQEFGWDYETMRFVNPSNPNDYFSNPTNAPAPGGAGGVPVGKQSEGSTSGGGAKMGGCGTVDTANSTNAASASGLLYVFPLFLLALIRRRSK